MAYLLMKNKATVSLLLIIALLSLPPFVRAEIQIRLFDTGTYKKIISQHKHDSFLMVLWSVDCPPCIKELSVLEKFHQLHPEENIVMISTDSKDQKDDIKALINKYNLTDIQQWVFSGKHIQTIRFIIDPFWYGELPRSYFYFKKNHRQAKSGELDQSILLAWLKKKLTTK